MPLDESPHGYEICRIKQDSAIKVLPQPRTSGERTRVPHQHSGPPRKAYWVTGEEIPDSRGSGNFLLPGSGGRDTGLRGKDFAFCVGSVSYG
jgi:hypothetical protein